MSLDVTVSTSEPFTAREPVQSPVAVHVVAFVELQVSVELPLVGTDVGDAVRVSVGAGGAPTLVVKLIMRGTLLHPGKLSL